MIKKINLKELKYRELEIKKTGEKLSLSSSINEIFDLKKIDFYHEILLPGRKASSLHSHSHKEEIIFILSGKPSMLLDNKYIELKAGDIISFKPGSDIKHQLENKTNEQVAYLSISAKEENDIVNYD